MQGNLRHGQGKLVFPDGKYYEGAWKLDRIEGFGKLYYPSGRVAYEGEWKNNVCEGYGICSNDKPAMMTEGYIEKVFNKGDKSWVSYEGEFSNNCWNGFGKVKLSNGDVIQGTFRMDVLHGRGSYEKVGGKKMVGEWSNNGLIQIF